MNLGSPELVPFELLHLELVSQIIHNQDKAINTTTDPSNTSSDSTATSNLELLGYNAGYRLIERLAKDYPKFKDELDLLKFICKDFWVAVFRLVIGLKYFYQIFNFRKQIDNLRTNHQGVYVLQDNSFKFLSKASQDRQYLEASPKFVAFTCGLVRGSLANLGRSTVHRAAIYGDTFSGVNTIVTAEVTNMPACKFQVQVQRN